MTLTAARNASKFQPELVVLLHDDASDAVTKALLHHGSRLGWPLAPISRKQLVDEVEFGDAWSIGGHRIHPERSAVINRLPMSSQVGPDGAASNVVERQAIWSRLRHELDRFGYVSSLPTASSIMGCFGSLLDQWIDMPRIVPGLRVPQHSTPSNPCGLAGNVFSVNRWTLYSLGKPLDEAIAQGLPGSVRLDYVRPQGRLVHLAQIGGSMFFPNAPPDMSRAQGDAIIAFARTLAAVQGNRILEHAFFLPVGAPVLYSTCPVPVFSGTQAAYPELVLQGLRDDIEKWGGRPRT